MHQNLLRIVVTIALFALLPAAVIASESPWSRQPAYFVNQYGYPRATKHQTRQSFAHEKRGGITLTGQFSVRTFIDGDLQVVVTYLVPSLKLAAVRYHLPHQWTQEQIAAALKAYGVGWVTHPGISVLRTWTQADGSKAILILNSFEFQSPEMVKMLAQAIVQKDAERKAVPKF